jgi:hypothetical protein
MGIDAVLGAENRVELASVSDSQMLLSRAAASGKFCQTHLLKYLVPWGDAVFNQAQAQDLRDDIRHLASSDPGSPLSQHLVAIDTLVVRLSQETHVYLWFIGD